MEPVASKYNLQITAVNMLPNETVILEEVTDEKENVDIPGNATATLGLLISGATRPLRFKAIVKSSNEIMYINGKKELLVDPMSAKGLESIIVIARKGMHELQLKLNEIRCVLLHFSCLIIAFFM